MCAYVWVCVRACVAVGARGCARTCRCVDARTRESANRIHPRLPGAVGSTLLLQPGLPGACVLACMCVCVCTGARVVFGCPDYCVRACGRRHLRVHTASTLACWSVPTALLRTCAPMRARVMATECSHRRVTMQSKASVEATVCMHASIAARRCRGRGCCTTCARRPRVGRRCRCSAAAVRAPSRRGQSCMRAREWALRSRASPPCSADRWRAAAPACRRRVRPACVYMQRCRHVRALFATCAVRADTQAEHRQTWAHYRRAGALGVASVVTSGLGQRAQLRSVLLCPGAVHRHDMVAQARRALFVPGREQVHTLASAHEWVCAVPTGRARALFLEESRCTPWRARTSGCAVPT